MATNPYKVIPKYDPQFSRTAHHLTITEQIPSKLSLISGDAINNLRSALDHLAYQFALLNGITDAKKLRQVQFPICESLKEYEALLPGKIKQLGKTAVEAISLYKPYHGGNETLWLLGQLNNIDKHRLLVTVETIFDKIGIIVDWDHARGYLPDLPSKFTGETVQWINVRGSKDAEVFRLVKPQNPLLYSEGDSTNDQNFQITFEIAFAEPGIPQRETVIETLQGMRDLVAEIVGKLATLL